MQNNRNIKRYLRVIDRSLFTIHGKLNYDRITDAIAKLAREVDRFYETNPNADESVWYLKEGEECYLADLIVGAYWHYSEWHFGIWHGGQWSREYTALSALGNIFSPGISGPEDDNPAYQQLESFAKQWNAE